MATATATATATLLDSNIGEGKYDNKNNVDISIDTDGDNGDSSSRCSGSCDWYNGNVDASGFSWLASGRGMLVMSNIFMSTSLLWLAKNEAGCFEDPTIEGECHKEVHGMKAESFVTNIATIAAVLSAIFMPICGAIVDYTPHRKLVGIVTATILIGLEVVQIGTTEQTWFAMGIIQAIKAFIFQLQIVVVFAYMPDISRQVDETTMTKFSSQISAGQYFASILFLVVITVISQLSHSSAVVTSHISQGLNTCTSIVFFGIGWYQLTPRPAVRKLPEGNWLLFEGYRQNWNTAKSVQHYYKHGLRWYLLAVVFSEASATSITTVSIVYLTSSIQLSTTQVGIFFIITLVATSGGTFWATFVTNRTNPNTSWKLSMVYLFVVLMIGTLVLDDIPQNLKELSYIWAIFVGLGLGWYYPTEHLFFSMCLPVGQEAEFAGFWTYCGQILAWFFPLLFSVLIENNISQKYGVTLVASGFLVAIICLMFTCSWEELIEEVNTNTNTISNTTSTTTKKVEGERKDDDNDCMHDLALDEEYNV
mmetsp:Transcript_22644/g.25972  ORF Transcript_22644/g.25972 Transcript_22644/m.25972 type:complete len:535 (+) Transcript_22644:111-1715(+)